MPDLEPSTVSEAFSTSREGAATGFVLDQIDRTSPAGRPILWVQDRLAAHEAGLPSARGIIEYGRPVLRIAAAGVLEALWAMEEGLECCAVSAVIGEVWGNPKALDFTATKRLALRSRRTGVPLWLLRPDGAPGLSVMPERWSISSAPSADNLLDPRAPGSARWQTDLFRSRSKRPGTWVAGHDRAAHRLDLVAALRDGPLAEGTDERSAPRPSAVGGSAA